ncbi:hypothetical protein [Curtobacterium sp. VKM Ac-1393]|uniref:hypothetical protein n=1 Tax=Curtobacterium sp. VKM Ac-1393 TaxID=2783814 RepID=UPI00188DA012|nr:hypothetical protein [Curtobacterium sp. VKM Ac-1393]MBF4606306.1 hypothetical protein [Curtobacterium sp. VKM Ac-1393]
MSSSKYLPPFTAAERVAINGGRVAHTPAAPVIVVADTEATYADFLADDTDE